MVFVFFCRETHSEREVNRNRKTFPKQFNFRKPRALISKNIIQHFNIDVSHQPCGMWNKTIRQTVFASFLTRRTVCSFVSQ